MTQIKAEDILSLNYYTYGRPFSGSLQGMRYRIILQKEEKNEAGEVTAEKGLMVFIWPEPFSFEKTDPEKISSKLFPFSEEGRLSAVDYLNQQYASGGYAPGFTLSQLKALRPDE